MSSVVKQDSDGSRSRDLVLDTGGRERALFQFIRNTFEHKTSKFSSHFSGPNRTFFLSESIISDLESRSIGLILEYYLGEVEFEGRVGYSDGSSRKYDRLKVLIESSGKDFLVENMSLKWSYFDISPEGDIQAGSLEFSFRSGSMNAWFFDDWDSLAGSMLCSIEGANEKWVRDCEMTLRRRFDIIAETNWISYPKKLLCSVAFWFILLSFLLVGLWLNYNGGLSGVEDDVLGLSDKDILLREMHVHKDVGLKLDKIGEMMVAESKGDAIARIFMGLMAGVMVSFVLAFVSSRLMVRVVPGSLIAVGERGVLAQKEQEGWRSVLFYLVLPLVLSLLTGWIFWVLS